MTTPAKSERDAQARHLIEAEIAGELRDADRALAEAGYAFAVAMAARARRYRFRRRSYCPVRIGDLHDALVARKRDRSVRDAGDTVRELLVTLEMEGTE